MTATKLPELLSWIVDGQPADAGGGPAARRQRLAQLRRDGVPRPTIFVGAGTCGLGAGAKETLAALHEYLDNHEIKADVVMVGCVGLCSLEPIVDVQLPGRTRVCYKQITARQGGSAARCGPGRFGARRHGLGPISQRGASSLGPTCRFSTSIRSSPRKPAGCWPTAA